MQGSIDLQNIDQLYGGSQIFWGLNMHIKEGACTCIMGLLPIKKAAYS